LTSVIEYPGGPGESRSSRRPTKATPVIAQLVACYGRASTDSCGGRGPPDHLLIPLRDPPYPRVHGVTGVVNSIFGGWRFDDVWLD
jgi:hypothetical protein